MFCEVILSFQLVPCSMFWSCDGGKRKLGISDMSYGRHSFEHVLLRRELGILERTNTEHPPWCHIWNRPGVARRGNIGKLLTDYTKRTFILLICCRLRSGVGSAEYEWSKGSKSACEEHGIDSHPQTTTFKLKAQFRASRTAEAVGSPPPTCRPTEYNTLSHPRHCNQSKGSQLLHKPDKVLPIQSWRSGWSNVRFNIQRSDQPQKPGHPLQLNSTQLSPNTLRHQSQCLQYNSLHNLKKNN